MRAGPQFIIAYFINVSELHVYDYDIVNVSVFAYDINVCCPQQPRPLQTPRVCAVVDPSGLVAVRHAPCMRTLHPLQGSRTCAAVIRPAQWQCVVLRVLIAGPLMVRGVRVG